MNDLVFLRHGHALGASEAGVKSDSERPLSALGLAEAAGSAERLRKEGFSPALIVSSPFRRAASTADIAAEFFPGARRLTMNALSEGDAGAVLDFLSGTGLPEGAGLLVVGHQPLIGALAGHFLAMPDLPMAPAGFARIRTGKGFNPSPANTLTEHYIPGGKPV
ncbi:MAG TPA: hypothetical protein DCZ92_12090 [Elusimicrobia bacterium]|nr:MAG: hypothetical protein A2016_11225 [Elusimicrobia bacterium GWF2_62_30]HBA61531.1 hypothetical protein [Elusimicrobiota bacterium]